MYTVIMTRANNAPVTRTNDSITAAAARVNALCELHALDGRNVKYDLDTKTFTVNADEYYR